MGKSRFEKHCLLCGAKYEYCGNCDRFNHFPRWMETLHNENCQTILHTVMEYRGGLKSAAEAAKILRSCDLSYRDKIKAKDEKMDAFITAILADGVEAEKTEVTPTLEVVEETPVAEVKAEAEPAKVEDKVEEKHEDHKLEKKNFNYKKNYKK